MNERALTIVMFVAIVGLAWLLAPEPKRNAAARPAPRATAVEPIPLPPPNLGLGSPPSPATSRTSGAQPLWPGGAGIFGAVSAAFAGGNVSAPLEERQSGLLPQPANAAEQLRALHRRLGRNTGIVER